TTDELQKMRFAFDLAGVGVEATDKALLTFGKRLGKARQGIGALVGGLKGGQEELLETLKRTGNMSEALDVMFRALGAATTQTEKLAIADAAFGTAGLRMTAAFRDGSKAFFEAKQEAERLGLVIEERLIRAAEQVTDDFTRASGVIGVQFKKAFLELAPVLSQVAQFLVNELPAAIKATKDAFADVAGFFFSVNQDILGALLFQDLNTLEKQQRSLRRLVEAGKGAGDHANELRESNRLLEISVKSLTGQMDGYDKKIAALNTNLGLAKKKTDELKPPLIEEKEIMLDLGEAMEGVVEQLVKFKGFGTFDLPFSESSIGLSVGFLKEMADAENEIVETRLDETLKSENEQLARRLELLQAIKNPLAEFKQFQEDIASQTNIFDPDKLTPEQANEAVAQKAEDMGLDLGFQTPEGDSERNSAFFEQMELRLDFMRDFVASEEELELQSHLRRLDQLQTFFDEGLIKEDDRRALELDLAQKHEDALGEIKERGLTKLEKFTALSWDNQTQTVLGAMVNITQGVARSNKTMFEINKVAAIGMAVVNAYLGISKTLSTYAFPLSIAMAGLQAAAAFAQVNAIRSQSFGGGGGAAPSLAGATAAPPVSDVGGAGGPQQNVIINLHGGPFGNDVVRQLIKEINEASKNGAKIVVN
ncbi:MAG: hypothetical protein IIA70_05035, partial [Proteobacteria bacterium]|nr:hypothetical protein [Pseudomonadota bacterium]